MDLLHWWPIITTVCLVILGVERWRVQREIKELKSDHILKIIAAKHDNDTTVIVNKQKQDYDRILSIVIKIETEMNLLKDMASKRHSEVQGRIGLMEVKLVEFASKHTAQIAELYRINGRRINDSSLDTESI